MKNLKIKLLYTLGFVCLFAVPAMAVSIWNASDTQPAAGTDRIPVDTSSSSSPGYLEVQDISSFTIASDGELSSIAGLTSAADTLPYYTGSGTAGVTTLTASARTILDDTTTAAINTTLGLGTASSVTHANLTLGTSGTATVGNGGGLRSNTTAGNTMSLFVRNTGGTPAYDTWCLATNGNPPTVDCDLTTLVVRGATNTAALASSSTITSTATGSIGWSVVTGANTACTTTCTSAAVVGFDTGTLGVSLPHIVGTADATADECLCAGGS